MVGDLFGKSVLIFGGTGAMGNSVVTLLENTGANVYVTSRSEHIDYKNVKFIRCNAKDRNTLSRFSTKKWDAIIDFMMYNTQEFRERVELLLAMTGQYIFISSARVYADSTAELTEDSPRLLDTVKDARYLATDEYALTKARQENILFHSAYSNWTIVRPSLTYNHNRLQLQTFEVGNWLYRGLKGRSITFTKDMADRLVTMTYGEDVAKGIIALIGKKECLGEAYHIVQGQSRSWKDILGIYRNAIEEKTGISIKVKYTDKALDAGIWRLKYGKYFNRRFDNSKISRFVDVKEFLPPENGLKLCVDKCIENKEYQSNINWIQQADIDKIVSEFTPLNEIRGKKEKIKYLTERLGMRKVLTKLKCMCRR